MTTKELNKIRLNELKEHATQARHILCECNLGAHSFPEIAKDYDTALKALSHAVILINNHEDF